MTREQVQAVVNKMIDHISGKIDDYRTSEPDWSISQGNVAVCIIDDAGHIYGKIWGTNKVRGRSFYDVAYRKASQVWITGYKTGEYERLVFSDVLNYKDFGIELPDLMGWEGGQPLKLDPETRISCGFSGFKGVNDLAIVKNALEFALGRG